MKNHYFDQKEADQDDLHLKEAKELRYVPETCLLGGLMVIALINQGKDPCKGCNCNRIKCQGRKDIKE